MSISERRTREKNVRRQQILDVAQQIAATEGWQMVSIRKIANQIEYSPPTIYEHFQSKDAILEELMLIGFRQLLSVFETISEQGYNYEDEVKKLASAYWDFAWEKPELYQVMHGLGGAVFGSNETYPELKQVFVEVRTVLKKVKGNHLLDEQALNDEVDLFWAMLHGLLSLTFNQRIAGGKQRAKELMEKYVMDYINKS